MQCQIDNYEYDYDMESDDEAYDRLVVLKKTEKCCECSDVINVGGECQVTEFEADGIFFKHTTCIVCQEIKDAFFCNYVFGEMWTDIREHYDDNDQQLGDGVLELGDAAKLKLEEFLREEE